VSAITAPPADHAAQPAASPRKWEYFRQFSLLLRDGLISNEVFTRSAALAYNTLFSLLPTFVLALIVISMISSKTGDSASMGQQVQDWFLNQSGLEQIQINGSREGKTEPVNIATFLTSRIEKMQGIVQSPATGIIGFATLLYGALNLMYVIEKAFAHVYRWPQKRPWTRRLTLYWAVLTLGPLGLAASLALSNYFERAAGSVVAGRQWVLAPLSLVAGFCVSWLLVFMMYKLIPQAVVAWRSALLGSFVGALLWEAGKFGFGIYIRQFVGAQKWYGNLGLIPLFMLWIYLTWNFVLIGLQVAFVHQFYGALSRQFKFRKRSDGGVTDLRWVLPLGVLLYRKFRAGHALTMEQACVELGMPSDIGEYLLRALRQNHLIHAVESSDKSFTLARPPEEITAADLIAAAKSACISADSMEKQGDTDARFAPGIVELQRREIEFQKTRTLPMLAGDAAPHA